MKKTWIGIIVAAVVVAGGVWLLQRPSSGPGKYDQFATCIKESGAIFYGAFWCPHCQAQKALFGQSAQLLPYVECSTPDGKSQTQQCTDAGVTGYPTWVFKNGTKQEGSLTFDQLAQATSCPLPQ